MQKHLCWLTLTSALLLAAGGCQRVLGFEELEAGGGKIDDSDGGEPSTGGPGTGTGTSGVACASAADCAAELSCAYGRCRAACSDDTECEQDSVCLFHAGSGGCRLAAETCEKGSCDNADLVCGLDGTCRIACGADDSCDSPTQRCIAGSCVSTVGENANRFDCGGVDDGQIACLEGSLSVCNVTAPGLDPIADCGSAALCERSLPADARYDADAPPACESGCLANQPYCRGSSLLVCKDDGSGPIDAGQACATKELCVASASASELKCRAPLCQPNETRCSGGQTELGVERCAPGRDEFTVLDYCEKQTAQCNPGASECAAVKIDATEVTVQAYQAFLASSPSVAAQPSACAGNAFAPDATCMQAPAAPTCTNCARPVVCVDWCDAYAYCSAQGQHLCGKLGGGMNPFDRYADAGSSEWHNGCSAGGQFAWASGADLKSGKDECTYAGTQIETSYEVGKRLSCKSPSPGYAALHDLSGNVAEWENSCEKDAASGGPSDACRSRGGSWQSEREDTRCDAVPASAATRMAHQPWLGFRCCG